MRLTADAQKTYDFVAALYQAKFRFDKLVPWLRNQGCQVWCVIMFLDFPMILRRLWMR